MSKNKIIDLPDEQTWEYLCSLFEEYGRVRRVLTEGEGACGNILLPSINEIRNGWDDIYQVLNQCVKPNEYNNYLHDARRHFRRTRSEVWEGILLIYLGELRTILNSLYKDPEYRVARAKHHKTLYEACSRATVALQRAKTNKHDKPKEAEKYAKEGVIIAQTAIDNFMKCAGEFQLAEKINEIQTTQTRTLKSGSKWGVAQISLAVGLFVLGILSEKGCNNMKVDASTSHPRVEQTTAE